MKAVIDGQSFEVKTIENLGFQVDVYAKVVMYQGKEIIITKKPGGMWQKHIPVFTFPKIKE